MTAREHGSEDGEAATVTQLLRQFRNGDRSAFDGAVGLLYRELQRIAHAQRTRWVGNHTMGTTALCQEAYLKLAAKGDGDWVGRTHFLSAASRAMRQILIDYVRAKQRAKRGGESQGQVPFDEVEALLPAPADLDTERADELVRLETCLRRLEAESPQHARIVECRFFGGMTIRETAEALEISPSSVKRGWAFAQAWLYQRMTGPEEDLA